MEVSPRTAAKGCVEACQVVLPRMAEYWDNIGVTENNVQTTIMRAILGQYWDYMSDVLTLRVIRVLHLSYWWLVGNSPYIIYFLTTTIKL